MEKEYNGSEADSSPTEQTRKGSSRHLDKIIDRVIHTCVYGKTVKYYQGLILFRRWILHIREIPESDVPKEFIEK